MRGATRPSPPNRRLVRREATTLGGVGAWCFDHRIAAVGVWLLGLAAVFGAAGAIGPAYEAVLDIPDSDSADGFAVLDEYFPEPGAGTQSGTIVFRADQGVDDPEVTAAMEELFALVDTGFPDGDGVPEHPGATVMSPYSEQGEGQVAGQGPLADEVAYAQVNLAADIDLTESALIGEAIAEHAPAIEGLEVFPAARPSHPMSRRGRS
jgi:putative drug exporter of the RND superfamily